MVRAYSWNIVWIKHLVSLSNIENASLHNGTINRNPHRYTVRVIDKTGTTRELLFGEILSHMIVKY